MQGSCVGQPIPLFILPHVIPHPPTPYVIRAWWTSSAEYVTDLVSAPGIGWPPLADGVGTRPNALGS